MNSFLIHAFHIAVACHRRPWFPVFPSLCYNLQRGFRFAFCRVRLHFCLTFMKCVRAGYKFLGHALCYWLCSCTLPERQSVGSSQASCLLRSVCVVFPQSHAHFVSMFPPCLEVMQCQSLTCLSIAMKKPYCAFCLSIRTSE